MMLKVSFDSNQSVILSLKKGGEDSWISIFACFSAGVI